MNWRPKEGWKNPYDKASVEYLDRASLICKMKDGTCMPNLIREAREHTFEAGADAMYEMIMKTRPSDDEIRVRIIEALYGAVSIPDFENWLKERLLLKP